MIVDQSVLAVIVVARMTSSRLPGKSLLSLAGLPVLEHVLTRVAMSQEADCLVVATSTESTDDPIADWCDRHGVRCFRGSHSNVAQRVFQAGKAVRASGLVRVSADSPFIDPALIDHAIKLFRDQEVTLVTNVFPRTFPKGQSVEVIAVNALERSLLGGLTPEQQEHVTKAFYDQPDNFRIANFATDDVAGTRGDHSWVQLSIDSEEDWVTANGVAELLGTRLAAASWLEVESAWLRVIAGRAS